MLDSATIQATIAQSRDEFVRDLATLIAVPSVRGAKAPHAPFGQEPRRVLDVAVALATQYGFKAKVVNDAMAYAQWGDDDQHYIGIVGHLDVVAAGTGWTSDPFTLAERAGRFYARGILDNKGPAFACLFGMKLLKDLGVQPRRTVRMIFGSDEESGSGDIPMYLASEPAPTFGWTPDCKYPVVYGERGIVNYRVTTSLPAAALAELGPITGDQAKDHVPDDLRVTVASQPLHVHGKRSPSNAPELGVNALTLLSQQIVSHHLVQGPLFDYFQWLDASLRDKHHGEGLGIDFADPDSGTLIVTPYLLEKVPGGLALELAMRYPVTFTEAQVTAGLEAHVPTGSTVDIVRSMPGTLHAKDDPFIQVLSDVYAEVTGLDGTPVTTTGATYAREMPNIIAFGPSFPGQKGIAHKEDEWMDEKDLIANMTIYMTAIDRLVTN
ncbi:Sapep family Mn(2+)-dependent dipeptidase [Lacticaseibacillus daqingensis]|uniref:Sapep family Mn(2+)-dependent dipeptidase n=1 Tax=Lacticaseibacillus daqingensis TaxID=2486014 RepID=UPI000F792F40|nr:Sapep family Mn(2+)-dependent dipeptidase [Lacticaseibacillus daqingensis]